jgi:DNA-binding phage protein
MPLTKDFRATVAARAERDPQFRAGLYQEAVQVMLEGDFAASRVLLRDFISATIGFPALAQRMGLCDKSLMRMFGPSGNPTASNLLTALRVLQDECQLTLTVHAKKTRPRQPGNDLRAA